MTDVAHVFDFDWAIGRVGESGRPGISETSEAYASFRPGKGFLRN